MGQALRDADAGVELLFVGSSHGPEGKIAEDAGIPFKAVPSGSLTKSLSFRNAASLMKLIAGIFRAKRILKNFAPDVVLGTGGYTTAAVLLAQWMLHGKIVVHEQNAIPGRTNRWLARIAKKVCVSFDSDISVFPKERVVVTGMPVRKEFASLPKKVEARRALGLDGNAFTILVVGGSQGAKKLNELILDVWPMIDDGNTQILHQVGVRNLDEVKAKMESNRDKHHIAAYLDMPVAVASADLVIGRSGASTIAEITAAGLPSILIPYPYAYADHQKLNAAYVADHSAAVMFDEAALTSESLVDIISELRSLPEKLNAMSEASASLGKADAANRVAEVVRSVANS